MIAPKRLALPMLLIATVGLSACGGYERDITLRKIRNTSNGPDEFTIVPGKPLEAPPSLKELPPPTPGAGNRTDQQPQADAVVALGGSAAAVQDRGISSADGALVAAASRGGVDPAIREKLAVEDEEFRRRKSRWLKFKIFRADEYYSAYEDQSVDPRAEQNRWRNAGAPTPTAPPPNK